MADLDTLKIQLEEAETALHQLQLGNKVVEMRVGKRYMNKTAADIGELTKYVRSLQSKVNRLEGRSSCRSPIRLPS